MCEIVGLLSLDGGRPVDRHLLRAMRDSLAYRGPDDRGLHSEGPIGFAHRRLSIIDLVAGRQPMIGAGGKVWLTYNGEIFNFRELRAELRAAGVDFQTHSDTEVLLASYLRWGPQCVTRLVGMFAFAIWDGRCRALYLVRDRLGIKPLFWTEVDRQVVFASEIAALFQHPAFTPAADLDAISSYLTFRQAVGDRSFYRGVNQVSPGHIVSFTNGHIQASPYWTLSPRARQRSGRSESAYVEEAHHRLRTAVKRTLAADVPIGAYLSGGVDSSVVVALMAELSATRVKTFSVGYPEAASYDESTFAREVAAHCGTEHHHLDIHQTEFLDLWRRLVEHRAQPLSIPHEIALYQLSTMIKSHVSVALSGEGADELFGGYGRVQRSPMDWKKVACARTLLGTRLSALIATRPRLRDTGFAQLACTTQMDHFFRVYNWMPFEEKWDLLSEDAVSAIDHDAATIGYFRTLFAALQPHDPYDRVLHVFERVHLRCLLDRLDAMSMAAGVEARVPFVDHELVEFVTTIPFTSKMRWNSIGARVRALFQTAASASERLDTSKHLLRTVGASLLPRHIAYRQKLGFPTPLDKWMATGLRRLASEMLLTPRARSRGIFDPVKLRRFLDSPQDLPFDAYGKKVWMLMNLELWFQSAIDRRLVRPMSMPSAGEDTTLPRRMCHDA